MELVVELNLLIGGEIAQACLRGYYGSDTIYSIKDLGQGKLKVVGLCP